MISNGMTRNRNKAVIPAIFRLKGKVTLFVKFIDLALYYHGSDYRKEKPQQHKQNGLVSGMHPYSFIDCRYTVTANYKEKIHIYRPYTSGKYGYYRRQDLSSGQCIEHL